MSKLKLSCLSLMAMLTVFFISYMVSYNISLKDLDTFLVRDVPPTIKTVDKENEIIIGIKTHLYVEEYDMDSGKIVDSEIKMPVKLLGINRGEMLEMMQDYMINPDVSEKAQGLLACELMEFTSESVTIRKTYSKKNMPRTFYLVDTDGEVSILREDKKTLYDRTEIKTESLSQELREEIKDGIKIMGADELYDFLETFTS